MVVPRPSPQPSPKGRGSQKTPRNHLIRRIRSTMNDSARFLSRRTLLKSVSSGFGYVAFAGLSTMATAAEGKGSPLSPKAPHFPAKAKRVIFLCMHGAPSHVDTFDYKPGLMANS